MNRFKSMLAVAVVSAITLPALAQTPSPATPRVDKREAAQQRRIDQGVQSGQLTPREAARAERGQARIGKMEERAESDGKVTPKERAQLQHAQNRESRQLAREKHDRQRVKK